MKGMSLRSDYASKRRYVNRIDIHLYDHPSNDHHGVYSVTFVVTTGRHRDPAGLEGGTVDRLAGA